MAVGWDRLVEVAQGMGPDPVFDDVSDGDLVGGLAAQAGGWRWRRPGGSRWSRS